METVAGSGDNLLFSSNKELKEVSKCMVKYENQMKNLSENFSEKNYLQLVWDSKVPEKDKRWYYFFSLKASDREDVIEDIKKYENFYKEMGDAIQKIRRSDEGSDSKVDPLLLICKLNELLEQMYKEAKREENFTSSSTLYNLHRSFQRQHTELEHAIKRVECVAIKSALAKAKETCEESKRVVENLENNVNKMTKKNEAMSKRLDNLTDENKVMQKKMDDVLKANEIMSRQIDGLCEYIRGLQSR